MKKKTTWLTIRFRWLSAAAVLLALAVACMLLRDVRDDPVCTSAGVLLVLAALTAVLATLRRLYAGLYRPLEHLREAVDGWQEGSDLDSLLLGEENLSDEVEAAARSIYAQLDKTSQRQYQLRKDVQRQTQRTVRRELAEEIGRSALPQVLPDYPSRENF